MTDSSFDFDLIVIGAGYGGFDAAKHAAGKGLKVAIVESSDMGGTCVNKGCVPSKALLAASGKVREIADYEQLAKFGIHTSPVRFERSKIESVTFYLFILEVYATLFRSSNNGTATQATFNDSTISLCGIVIVSLKASWIFLWIPWPSLPKINAVRLDQSTSQ